ncbi:MAG: hypothetical protein IT318_02840 [Anaerolineales bacterium]|nr:hypothetical protein [Anaerolineales bacterium]
MRQAIARGFGLAVAAGIGLCLAALVQWRLAGVALAAPLDRPRASTVVPSGTLVANTTWTAAGSPYLVEGPLAIGTGYTLTIEPGVTVQLTRTAWLQVQNGAALIAEGTPVQPIVFTGRAAQPQPGDWLRLEFYHTARVRLAHCDIGYGGGSGGSDTSVYIGTSGLVPDVSLRHCRVHDSNADGLQAVGDVDMQLVLEDTRFDHNAGIGLRLSNPRAIPDYDNLTFDHNGVDGMFFDGLMSRGQFWQDATLDGAKLNGSPFVLANGSFNVRPGVTVTVRPGTELRLRPQNGVPGYLPLVVHGGGNLLAEGTPGNPITFTSGLTTPQPGDWGGLEIAHDARARLAYCDLGYGGAGSTDSLVYLYTAGLVPDVSLRHCRVHDSDGNGMYVSGDVDMQLVLEDTRFDHNAGIGLRLNNPRAMPDYRNLSFDHNGVDGMYFDGAQSRGQFWQDAVLDGAALNGSPIILANGSFNVRPGVTVTVKPGSEVQFITVGSSQLIVHGGGNFFAEGTPGNPITFTSGLTTPQPGDWGGFYFATAARARLAFCDIGYAGYSGGPNAVLYIQSSDVHLRRCRIHDNPLLTLYTYAAQPVLLYNRFEGGTSGVYNPNPAYVVDARANWWGHASGPQHPSLNPGGQGLPVTDGVLFDPWLADPAAAALIVWPDRGGNTGRVTVNLARETDLPASAVVRLTRAGQPDLLGNLHPAARPGDPAQVTFDLTGAATGPWNVAVDDGGTTAVLPDGFTVEAGQAPQFWFDLQSRLVAVLNRPAQVALLYGNTANVDAPATHLRFIAPEALAIATPPEAPHRTSYSASDQANFIDLYLPRVPAQSMTVIPLRLTGDALGDYVLGLRADGPSAGSVREDHHFGLSVTALVTDTNSLTTTVHRSGDLANGDIHFSLGARSTTELLPLPLITKTVTGGLVRYEIVATLPSSSALGAGLAAGSGTHLDTIIETTNEVNDAIDTVSDAYDETTTTANKIVTQADLIDCMFDNNMIDSDDVSNLTRFNEGTGVLSGIKIGLSSVGGGGAPGAYVEGLSGVMDSSVEMYITQMANSGRLMHVGIYPGSSRQEILDAVRRRCPPGDSKDKPLRVRASADPNEKMGPLGAGGAHYISGIEPLRYTIYFENLMTATLPAQVVVITDVLDADLDGSTLAFGPMTFGSRTVPAPAGGAGFTADVDLRPAQDLIVRANATFDAATGVITWQFSSLDPATAALPDDAFNGFLPPNTDGSGEGSVFFTVRARPGLPADTEIRNQGVIVFDLNAAITTGEWVNTIDASAPESAVAALPPAQTAADISVSWAGADTGAGVADYTVYVSRSGGPFTPWLTNTPETSAVYRASVGGTYAFYSVARDGAGNVEAAPAGADTAIQVTLPGLYLPLVTR